jgi:hypothetical protein
MKVTFPAMRIDFVRCSSTLACWMSRRRKTGYGYCLPPYGTAYRSALRTTRTRTDLGCGVGLSRAVVRDVPCLAVDVDG